MRHAPAVSYRIERSVIGMSILSLFATIYIAIYAYLTVTTAFFTVKALCFLALCSVICVLCGRALFRQHAGLLRCENSCWTWEPSVSLGALTHHPVVEVSLAVRFDLQCAMLLRLDLHEIDHNGGTLGTTAIWLLALRSRTQAGAWQDLRRAVHAPTQRAFQGVWSADAVVPLRTNAL